MNKIYTIFLFCLLSLLSSCHNKELCPDCYNEPGIEVQFNWSEVTTIPNGMRVNFYNQDGSLAYSFNLPSSGGSITIKQGDYKVLCFNNDSEYIQYRDQDNYYSMSFFTSEGEPISGTTPIDGQVRNNPQYLCYDTLSSQKIY